MKSPRRLPPIVQYEPNEILLENENISNYSMNSTSYDSIEQNISKNIIIENKINSIPTVPNYSPPSISSSNFKKSSSLPSWVLKIRTQIEDSRKNYDEVQSDIDLLVQNTEQLSLALLLNTTSTKYIDSLASPSSSLINNNNSIPNKTNILSLPSDVLSIILQFLPIECSLKLSLINKQFQEEIESNSYWITAFINLYPQFNSNFINSPSRANIISRILSDYEDLINTNSLSSDIKSDSSTLPVLIKNSINPRLFLNKYTAIIFKCKNLLIYSSTTSSLLYSIQDTFKYLQSLEKLTSQWDKRGWVYLLGCEEGCYGLFKLLSNSDPSIRTLSCSVLANILAWEGFVRRLLDVNLRINFSKDDLGDLSYYDNFLHNLGILSSYNHHKISEYVDNLNIKNVLKKLLTSPSASVSLTNGLNGHVEGICSKHASRAYLSFIHHTFPIFTYDSSKIFKMKKSSQDYLVKTSLSTSSSIINNLLGSTPTLSKLCQLSYWETSYYYRSGGLRDTEHWISLVLPYGKFYGISVNLKKSNNYQILKGVIQANDSSSLLLFSSFHGGEISSSLDIIFNSYLNQSNELELDTNLDSYPSDINYLLMYFINAYNNIKLQHIDLLTEVLFKLFFLESITNTFHNKNSTLLTHCCYFCDNIFDVSLTLPNDLFYLDIDQW